MISLRFWSVNLDPDVTLVSHKASSVPETLGNWPMGNRLKNASTGSAQQPLYCDATA